MVRIHTRVPVAAPALITPALVRALKAFGKATYVVLHANHARELTPAARTACARLVDAGIPMLSQSVLLRGVNDDAATLSALLRALVECRIKPYYLHHGDLAPGTAHLRTTIAQGQALMRALRGRVSGLCQPAYMLDIPGGHGKSPIGPSYIRGCVGHARRSVLRGRGFQRRPAQLPARLGRRIARQNLALSHSKPVSTFPENALTNRQGRVQPGPQLGRQVRPRRDRRGETFVLVERGDHSGKARFRYGSIGAVDDPAHEGWISAFDQDIR